MSNQFNTAIDPDEAVSAFFETLESAERAEARLKSASFPVDAIYLVPRAPGFTVTVATTDRIDEARQIMEKAGGDLREADINASGSVMFRLSPEQAAPGTGKKGTSDDDSSTPRRTEDEDGAGIATGGAIF